MFDGAASEKKQKDQWRNHFTEKAKLEGYPARSVYKLEEIHKRFGIIKSGDRVVDLGCAPGSWLIYAAKQVGSLGRVFGIDLKRIEIDLPFNVNAIQADIFDLHDQAMFEHIRGSRTLLSDMAPATTGRKDVDVIRSVELCRKALDLARNFIERDGNFVCKIFQGNEFKVFEKEVQSCFRICKIFKPESCRKQSREIYIIGKGKQ